MKDGKTLDNFGNIVNPNSTAAHIPIDEFIFNEDLFYVN
jgi:hypothetical protein